MEKKSNLAYGLVLAKQSEPEYIYHLFVREVVKASFDIEGLVRTGEPLAIVDIEGARAIIPASEFSYIRPLSERLEGKYVKAYLLDIVELEYEDGDAEPLVIFSTKAVERKATLADLNELQESEYVLAQVIAHTDFGVILAWKHLRLTLTRRALLGRDSVADPSIFLKQGDILPVRFLKTRKKGKTILVEPLVKVPDPAFSKIYSLEELQERVAQNPVFDGVISGQKDGMIFIQIARHVFDGDKSKPVTVRCTIPHEILADSLFDGQVVSVRVRPDTIKNKKGGTFVSGSGMIQYVEQFFLDDLLFDFKNQLARFLNKKGGDSLGA